MYAIINTRTGQLIGYFNTRKKARRYVDAFERTHGINPYVIEKTL